MPVIWNADINNNVGSATLSHSKKVISGYPFNELFKLMAQVMVKEHPSTDTSIVPALFHSSFVVDPKCPPKDMEYMINTWVRIKDDREIVDAIVDEELGNIDDLSEMDIDVYDGIEDSWPLATCL